MISEKRLYGVVSLTGIDFQKQGRGAFFLPEFLYGIAEREVNPHEKRQ